MSLPARPAKPTVLPTKQTGSVFSRLEFPTQRDYHETSPNNGLALTGEQRKISAEMRYSARVPTPGHEPEGGKPAVARRLTSRLIKDGERTYRAYSLDELMEIDSQAHHGRPGMPY